MSRTAAASSFQHLDRDPGDGHGIVIPGIPPLLGQPGEPLPPQRINQPPLILQRRVYLEEHRKGLNPRSLEHIADIG
jgi:hypothetical protein